MPGEKKITTVPTWGELLKMVVLSPSNKHNKSLLQFYTQGTHTYTKTMPTKPVTTIEIMSL